MTQQFREQGGAATMDPGRLLRWTTSRLMTRLSRPQRLQRQRARLERERQRQGRPHRVEYFHQVDDGYSHLAAQLLQQLAARYDIELACHLVSGPHGRNLPEPDLLLRLSRYDSRHVAPHYGLDFPGDAAAPDAALFALAREILAAQDDTQFAACAAAVGDALWRADRAALDELAQKHGRADAAACSSRVAAGDARIAELGHYSGAMFHYAKEWYWGVDRLYHLESRLASLGADRRVGETPLVERPGIETGPLRDDGSLTLEIYPSLRSPYTAISFDRALALAAATGVTPRVRPVLPMVMRGVPATRQKGMYIFFDAAREARAAGVPYGNFYDPIGEPARRAYSLWPWAEQQGRGNALISAFLSCAFADGVNTNTPRGLRKVVERAGLSWREAQTHLGDPAWQGILEDNRQAMYAAGLWGVPSFRLLDAQGEPLLALWGQDRLWLFAREIQRQLASR
ncbi:MAG: 2-hydroxychromene-2-carboxylate isomerase [Halioglobus sp.]|nr:2-hydroxychromene-2-carboxylate isomerase [Halioglobus sp.]